MAKRKRRKFAPEEKVGILKRHLVDKIQVSDICDEYGLNPNVFYRWQTEFFEKGAAAFERKRSGGEDKKDLKIERLEAKLADKNEVVAEIMAELIAEKKRNGEI